MWFTCNPIGQLCLGAQVTVVAVLEFLGIVGVNFLGKFGLGIPRNSQFKKFWFLIPRNSQKFQMEMKLDLEFLRIPTYKVLRHKIFFRNS